MLGTRPDIDTTPRSISLQGNGKSHKFATQLSGRFHVAGLSGSLAKHTKLRQPAEVKKKQKVVTAAELASHRRLEAELEKDAEHLQELERKLEEVRRQRELKRQRDRRRRLRKLQWVSATKIQGAWRRLVIWRKDVSCHVIASFIRTINNRQIFAAAAWAAKIIRRFAWRVSNIFRHQQLCFFPRQF